MKATHKLRALGDVSQVVAECSSVAAAAKRLGVSRQALYDWINTGKVPRPAGRSRRQPPPGTARPGQSPKAWARAVRRAYDLSATEQTIVDLAIAALTLARDAATPPAVRLAAMGRYQALVRQLALDEETEHGETQGQAAEIRPFPRRVS